jgi:prepilin-type N-terminal cleavage/methylation domain-containing protein
MTGPGRRKQSPCRRVPADAGFTLFEMLVTVAILAIVAAATLPALSDDTRLRLMAASALVSSDIELAQTMTIARPQEAAVIRFDAEANTYWIALVADPETPIIREESGEPYQVTIGVGRASSADGVNMALIDLSADALEFNSQGGLANFTSTPTIELRLGTQRIRLTVSPTTGSITESFGSTDDGVEAEPDGLEATN